MPPLGPKWVRHAPARWELCTCASHREDLRTRRRVRSDGCGGGVGTRFADQNFMHPETAAGAPSPTARQALALVIVWSAREPHRIGEVALFPTEDRNWVL